MAEKNEARSGAIAGRVAWRRWLCNRWSIAGTLALLFYALAGFFLAPWLVGRQVPRYVEEQLQHQASLGRVRINPFTFTFEVKEFRLQDGAGEPLLEFARLFVDFEVESIFRRAWTFADISLETPVLHLLIDEQGRLNLARFLEMLPEKEEPPDETPARFFLKHSALSGGTMHFADHSGSAPVRTTFAPVAVEFNEISTLPERSGAYALTALLPEGGSLGWQGEISLAPLASHGTLTIADFQPAALWKFFQGRVNLAAPAGLAQLSFSYRFAHQQGETALVVDPLNFSLQGLVLQEKGRDASLLHLESVEAAGASFDLAERRLHFPRISLRGGELAAAMDRGGVLDWQKLPASASRTGESEGAAGANTKAAAEVLGEEKPWQLAVDSFAIDSLALHYADESRGAPFLLDVEDAALSLAVQAEVGAGPARVLVSDFSLYLQGISNREPTVGEPLWAMAGLRLDGGSLDLAQRRLRVESLALAGGSARLLRDARGAIRQVQVLGGDSGEPADKSREEAGDPQGEPWNFALERLELADFTLDYVDQAFRPALEYGLRDLGITVAGIDSEGKAPMRVAARARVAQGGSLEAEGTLAQGAGEAAGQVKVSRLNLKPLEPLLVEHLLLRLASGNFSLNSRISYRTGKNGPAIKAGGSVAVNGLLLNESETGERFLAWKELAVSGIDFSLAPDRLAIREVKLLEPGAKIVIFKDRSANLGKIVREKAEEPGSGKTAAAGKQAAPKPFPLSVERVRLEKGVVDFADLSLVLPFAARIEKFGGTALNITSRPAGRTTLQFSGQVGEFGQANVDGSLAPLNPRGFTDIKVVFRNVELAPMSPYTATFAGRRIADGRLDLDLGYRIEESELLGDNKVLLKNFTLGERVESPGALRLPLDLAIALLTDSQGRIDLAVPVRGNVDSPEFSYGHLVWQAVLNLLNRIVTAPFRALGALFGSGAQQPDTVFFTPGQAEPAPPEREKLRKVAEVLGQRPQLALTVHGAFARDLDGTALRSLAVRRVLAQRLGVKLAPEEDPGPVAFDNGKSQRALEAMAGSASLAEFEKGFAEKAGRKARRANPALVLLGRGSDDLDFYRALFHHLVEAEPLAEEKLQALAGARRDEVIRELGQGDGLGPERLLAGTVAEAEAKDGSVPLKMELGAR
jgi:uncharacterized protein involved in outer membrane biogenesis